MRQPYESQQSTVLHAPDHDVICYPHLLVPVTSACHTVHCHDALVRVQVVPRSPARTAQVRTHICTFTRCTEGIEAAVVIHDCMQHPQLIARSSVSGDVIWLFATGSCWQLLAAHTTYL